MSLLFVRKLWYIKHNSPAKWHPRKEVSLLWNSTETSFSQVHSTVRWISHEAWNLLSRMLGAHLTTNAELAGCTVKSYCCCIIDPGHSTGVLQLPWLWSSKALLPKINVSSEDGHPGPSGYCELSQCVQDNLPWSCLCRIGPVGVLQWVGGSAFAFVLWSELQMFYN